LFGGQGNRLMAETLREECGVHSILLGGSNRRMVPLSINLRPFLRKGRKFILDGSFPPLL
jgi:hypothetical protein